MSFTWYVGHSTTRQILIESFSVCLASLLVLLDLDDDVIVHSEEVRATMVDNNMSEEERLRQEVEQLRRKLEELSTSFAAQILTKSEDNNISPSTTAALAVSSATTSTTTTLHPSGLLPPERKSGYLFKWQDRSIGWGGTKWALRYVRLDGPAGQLSYYKSHEERNPRYILTLKNCAVRDEGSKKVKGFKERVVGTATHASDPSLGSTTTTDNNEEEEDPPEKHEAGSHYYVFSVHLRTTTTTNQEEEDTIVPLLRFSTQSYAEKMLWIDLISQTCEA